jgi:hypothetical protein
MEFVYDIAWLQDYHRLVVVGSGISGGVPDVTFKFDLEYDF